MYHNLMLFYDKIKSENNFDTNQNFKFVKYKL